MSAQKPRRRWYQPSLRKLAVFALVLGLLFGGWFVLTWKARRQRRAVAALRQLGAYVRYDYQLAPVEWYLAVHVLNNPESVQGAQGGIRRARTGPPGPRWLRRLLGKDFFSDVLCIQIASAQATDSDLEPLKVLPRVQRLYLCCPRVTDAGLACLAAMTDLRILDIKDPSREGKITGAGLAHLARLTRLQSLDLYNVPVTDAELAHLQGLTNLKFVQIVGDHRSRRKAIGDAGLAHLKGLAQLEFLLLPGRDVPDAGVAHLARLTNLRELSVSGSHVTTAGMAHLKGLRRLESLSLGLTDAGLVHLTGFPDLRKLGLVKARVTGAGMVHLRALPRLEGLWLGGRITDACLVHLSGLANLRKLVFRGSKITDAGLLRLEALAKLRTLWLLGTQVTEKGVKRLQQALPKCTIRTRL